MLWKPPWRSRRIRIYCTRLGDAMILNDCLLRGFNHRWWLRVIGREKVIGPIKFGSICLPRKPIFEGEEKEIEEKRAMVANKGGGRIKKESIKEVTFLSLLLLYYIFFPIGNNSALYYSLIKNLYQVIIVINLQLISLLVRLVNFPTIVT